MLLCLIKIRSTMDAIGRLVLVLKTGSSTLTDRSYYGSPSGLKTSFQGLYQDIRQFAIAETSMN